MGKIPSKIKLDSEGLPIPYSGQVNKIQLDEEGLPIPIKKKETEDQVPVQTAEPLVKVPKQQPQTQQTQESQKKLPVQPGQPLKSPGGGSSSNPSQSKSLSGTETGNEFELIPDILMFSSPEKGPAYKQGQGFTDQFLLKQKSDGKPISLKPSPQMKKMYEDTMAAREQGSINRAKEIAGKAYFGNLKADELKDLYDSPNGQDYAKKIVKTFSPENTLIDEENKNWEEIAKQVNTVTVKNRKEQLSEYQKQLDAKITSLISGKYAWKNTSGGSTGGGWGSINKTQLSSFNINDISQYPLYLGIIKQSDGIASDNGSNVGDKNELIYLLNLKSQQLNMGVETAKEIVDIEGKLKNAVARANIRREYGENIKSDDYAKHDDDDLKNIQTGLTYAKNIMPGKYKAIMSAINEKETISDVDYRTFARIGQEINNSVKYESAIDNPDLIGTETDFDYTSFDDKKSIYSNIIGEHLKSKGYNNVREYSSNTIRTAAKELGLTNEAVVNELAWEEGLLAYDAIPKTGAANAFYRGVMMPIEGIKKTIDIFKSDDPDVYLKSQQFDTGFGQKVPTKDGSGMSNRLTSDQGNIFYDAIEGFGQFIPQVILAKGIGAGLTKTAGAALPKWASITPQSANIATNYGGTFISTYLQEYGSAYENALSTTGDGKIAKAMAAINGISAAGFELFLPDSKIADNFKNIIRKDFYPQSLLDVIRKGGDVTQLKKSGRDVIAQVVSAAMKSGSMVGQEVSEEVGTNIANYITEAIFSPKTASDRDMAEEIMETAKATAVSMSIPALLGGAGARAPQRFTVNALHSAAIGINSYKPAIDASLSREEISQDEYNQIMSTLNTHRQSLKDAPKMKAGTGKPMSSSEMYEYAYQDTRIKIFKQQMQETESDVKKEMLNEKISEAQNIQRSLVGAKVENESIADDSWKNRVISFDEENKPIRTVEDIEKDLEYDLTEEELADAKAFVNELVDADAIPASASIDPELARQRPLTFLRFIAEQSQGYVTDENGNVTKSDIGSPDMSVFGETLVNYANSIWNFSKQSIDESIQNYSLPSEVKESVDPILKRINDADYINENELDLTADILYDVLDSVEKSSMTDQEKMSATNLIEPLINKLERYEFRTTTKTVKVKQGKTSIIPKQVAKKEIKPALEQAAGSRVVYEKDGKKVNGLLKIENGNYVIYDIDGNKAASIGDKTMNDVWLSLPDDDDYVSFDKDGNVSSVKFITKEGGSISIQNSDKALDLAIQIRAEQVGSIPDELFELVYEEFDVEVQEEVMVNNDNGVSGNAATLTVPSFGDRIAAGEQMSSPEDLQFYDNNKDAIEQYLKDKVASQETDSRTNGSNVESTDKLYPVNIGEFEKDEMLSMIGIRRDTVEEDPESASGIESVDGALDQLENKIQSGNNSFTKGELEWLKAEADDLLEKTQAAISADGNPEAKKRLPKIKKFVSDINKAISEVDAPAETQDTADQGQPEPGNGQNADQVAAEPSQAGQGAENGSETAPGGPAANTEQPGQQDTTTPPEQGGATAPSGLNADLIGISHAATDAVAREFNLPEYEKDDPQSIQEWDDEADKLLASGYDVNKLLNRYRAGKMPSAVEQRIMLRYIAHLKIISSNDPTNENLAALLEAKKISDITGGREVARSLRARSGLREVDKMTYADWLVDEMEDMGVDELLEVEKVEIKEEYDALMKAHDALKAHSIKLQQENAKLKAEKFTSEEKKKKRAEKREANKKGLAEQRKVIIDDIKKKWNDAGKGTLYAVPIPFAPQISAIAPDVIKLARNFIQDGIETLPELVDKIHSVFSGDDKLIIEKKDIIDILAGVYNKERPSKSEVSAKLRDLRIEAELIKRYEDLTNGIVRPKNKKEQLEQRREIKELKDKIKNHDLTKIEDAKSNLKTQIKKLEDQLLKDDFKKVEKEKIELDEEGKRLQKEYVELKKKRDIRRLKNQFEKRSGRQKAVDKIISVLNVPRSLMASMDFSAPLNQGIIATLGYPGKAKEAFSAMFKAAFDSDYFDQYFIELEEDPLYEIMKKVKLGIADPQSPFLVAREEAYMSGYAEQIPFIGTKLVKGSERAYVMYLNKLRVDLFKQFISRFVEEGKTYDNSKKLYEQTARYVNNITGRGNLGKLEQLAPVLNTFLFSPRMMYARIQMLNPFYYVSLPKELRRQYRKDMALYLSQQALILNLFALYGKYVQDPDDEDERITVEWDPRSSDFGKVKQGNTRWNFSGGFQPYLRFYSQVLSGERKTTTFGQIQDLDGEGPFGENRLTITGSFIRGKLAPVPAALLDIGFGRNAIGEEVDPFSLRGAADIAYDRLVPLFIQTMVEGVKERGPEAFLSIAPAALFGVGTGVYGERMRELKTDFTFKGKKVHLNEDQFSDYEKTAKIYMREYVEKVKNVEEYKSLSPDDKVKANRIAMDAAVKKAQTLMSKKYPEQFRITDTDKKEKKDNEDFNKAIKKAIED